MIKKIRIRNYLSHKDSALILSPKVNIITGSSDSGKTAIFRAIRWVLKNRPSGSSFVSYWNKNKRGSLLDSTYVKIVSNNNSIIRKRSQEFNGYIINKNKLDAGTALPDDIPRLLNIDDINIQGQLDRPFLVSESPSDIARIINNATGLDIADRILDKIEKKRREANSEISYIEDSLDSDKKAIDSLAWVDEAVNILKEAESINNEIAELRDKAEGIEEIIKMANPIMNILDKYVDYEAAEKIYAEAKKIIDSTREAIDKYEALKLITDNIPIYKGKIQDHTNLIDELTNQLPNICPVCGSPLKKGK